MYIYIYIYILYVYKSPQTENLCLYIFWRAQSIRTLRVRGLRI